MKKQMKKTLALVLVLCLMVSAVPVAAVSAEDSPAAVPEVSAEPEQSLSVEETTTPETAEEVTVLYEDESLRGEYEKHFLMSDGSYQAVVYGYPVHELVDGVWVEIESTNQNARSDVSPDSAQTNILDNFVWEGHGVQNSDGVRLYIGNRSGYECQAYIQFATMPTIPAGATITAATMTVNIVSGTSTANNAKAFQVTGGEWTSSTLQWSNKPVADISLEENISHNNKTKYQFSCLSAVQHWYDGDTTGQNENYGIMLCYQDPEIADYNSFYSADCTDATMRPALTISYDPQKITIEEGETCNLSVSRATGTVIWSSSNAVVASVSSTGVVSGNKAGRATITASVNGTIVKEYLVYVKIIEGLFYIRNKSTGYYMSTKDKEFSPGTRLIQSAKVTPKSDGLWQIWRISYMSDGLYSLRPMHMPNMGLGYDGVLELQDIGTAYSVSAIGENALWTMVYCNGGYEISNCAHPNYSICGVNSQCDSDITVASTSSAPIYRWLLEPITVDTDLILYTLDTERVVSRPRRGVAPGQSRTLEDINLTFAVSSVVTIGQIVYWESSNESVATVDRFTGVVTGVSAGETQIQGTAWVAGVAYSETYTLVVSEIPISGSELPYEPEIWNDNGIFYYTNCYAYILNNQRDPINNFFGYNCTDNDPRQQPGEFYNENKDETELLFSTIGFEENPDLIREAAVKDSIIYDRWFGTSLKFASIDKYDTCPDGAYKVALFINPSFGGEPDYHWYRQNPDGSWSHKRGQYPVINTVDYENYDIVIDPEQAAEALGYTISGGYYAISPWNNLYAETANTIAEFGLDSLKEAYDTVYIVSQYDINKVELGMTTDQVKNVLGCYGRSIGNGALIEKYTLDNGNSIYLSYALDECGVYKVSHISDQTTMVS